jgi:glyoxylase I family protein
MESPTFAHVAINCRNMDIIEQFYCRHFGFRRARLIPLGESKILFLRNDASVSSYSRR